MLQEGLLDTLVDFPPKIQKNTDFYQCQMEVFKLLLLNFTVDNCTFFL